jgi:glutathione S-transferase
MLKLFYAPGTIALASHIALLEREPNLRPCGSILGRAINRNSEYLSVNPKGRVPALVTDRGVLTETPAILTYIAQTWPEAGLAPLDDPFAFAQTSVGLRLSLLNRACGPCAQACAAIAGPMMSGQGCDDSLCAALHGGRVCNYLEDEVFGALGDGRRNTPSPIPTSITIAGWLEGDGVDPAPLQDFHAHSARMEERAAVQAALALHTFPD